MIVRAVSHRDAAVLAVILKDHCPGVAEEVKKTIREELKTSCPKLCRRSQGSVFYGYHYNSMRDFDFNKIWLELKTNLPFLVELMNAVSGKENSIAETNTTRDSLKDEKEMVSDLLRLNPFNHMPARFHDSFPDIKRSPLRYLNIVDYHQWLAKHLEELST